MPWGALAAVAGAAISGSMAEDAADDQLASQNAAREDANKQFELTRKDQLPFLQTGYGANDLLATRLGLPTQSGGEYEGLNRLQLREKLVPQFTQKVAVSSPGGNALLNPGLTSVPGFVRNGTGDYHSSEAGYQAPQQTYNDVIDENALNAEIARIQAEQQARTKATTDDPNFGSFLKPFTENDIRNDPVFKMSFDFGAEQGQNALNRMASAGGRLQSGRAAKDLMRFGTGYASQQAGGAMDRLTGNRMNEFNMLSTVSGRGQVGAQGLGSQRMNLAQMSGNYLINGGDAIAGGYANQSNAIQQGLGGVYGAYKNWQHGQDYNALNSNLHSMGFGWAQSGSLGD